MSMTVPPKTLTEAGFEDNQMAYKFVVMLLAANQKIWNLFGRFVGHEALLIASGISFKARSEKSKEDYNSIRCMDVTRFTWSPTAKEAISNWNMRTQHWLKYYVMLRSMDRSLPRNAFQLKAIVWTFAVSAGFHGLYVGYYLFFAGLFILDLSTKLFLVDALL